MDPLGLVGLFSACLDVIDKVDSYKDFGVDSRSVIAQFEADKHLFTKWAHDVGIDKEEQSADCQSSLEDPRTNLIVQRLLSSIQEIFSKTEPTVSALRPTVEAGPTSFPDGIHLRNTREKSQRSEGTVWQRSRIGWSLRRKAKFTSQVQQFESLVQKLYSLVPLDGLTRPAKVYQDGEEDLEARTKRDEPAWFSSSRQLLIQIAKQIENETRKELDIWLGASWTNDIYDESLRKRLDGTCDWILSRQVFLDWISPDFRYQRAKFLWIKGAAGHGKTILCAKMVQYLSSVFESPILYYFCSSDSKNRREPLTIIRSWISQIVACNQDAFELACGRWESKDGPNASSTDIVDLFKIIVRQVSNLTFVVDGLDEYTWAEEMSNSYGNDSSILFFESLEQAVAHTNTRVLIVSRDEPEIRHGIRTVVTSDGNQNLTEYQIRPDDIRADAALFSRDTVDRKLRNKSETLKSELSERMVDRSGGMFLWVKMLDLRSGKNKTQLEATIDQAPVALDHLYDRIWMKILSLPNKDKLRALSILRWTAFALRPLTILEITEALLVVDDNGGDLSLDNLPDAIDEDYINSEILGLCGSLLELRKAAPEPPDQDLGLLTVHLAHFSVKQYILCHMPFQGERMMADENSRDFNEAHQNNELAQLCLRYLNVRNVWQECLQLENGPLERPFRGYAATSWHQHIREVASNYGEVVKLNNMFFNSSNRNFDLWKAWFDVVIGRRRSSDSLQKTFLNDPLFYASLLGLRDTVIYLLEEVHLDVNHTDGSYMTALEAAAENGKTSTVQVLLEHGADSTIVDRLGLTPLHSASSKGYIDTVRLLLENEADVIVANYEGYTPLHLASINGHIEIVKLLLDKKADITVAAHNGWTSLLLACSEGHIHIVRLLLEKGADAKIADHAGWIPLHEASYYGHVEIIKLLLETGPDLTTATSDGWTAMHLACSKGHIDIAKLSLEGGADINAVNHEGFTPLQMASYNGHIHIVELLLENGTGTQFTQKAGNTPLHLASKSGNTDIVKLLLVNGADRTISNTFGRTPLRVAFDWGYIDIVKILFETGTDLMSLDEDGNGPLHSASFFGHVDLVKFLIENGADVNSASKAGQTPLVLASRRGKFDVVKLLLEKKANTEEACGETSLIFAVRNGDETIVRLLLAHGAEVESRDDIWVQSPLSIAVYFGNESIVKLLLATSGVEPDSKDSTGRTPLFYAAKNGDKAIVELLLATKRVDIDLQDHHDFTPLSISARSGCIEVVAVLLRHNCDFSVKDVFDRTPLWWARKMGHHSIVDLLLQKYKDTGTVVPDDELPVATIAPVANRSSISCDVCWLSISEGNTYHHCKVCSKGDFDICEDCLAMKAHCLDESHTLIEKVALENSGQDTVSTISALER